MNNFKLNVGCASNKIEGYINIDCRKTEATDHVCHAGDISIVPLGVVSEIYSRHMLEHLDPNEAREVLHHWYDLLESNGLLHVIVPDIEFHARQLLGMAESSFDDQVMHAFAGFWGWRDEQRGGSREDAHRWGYSEHSLALALADAGFVGIRRLQHGADVEQWHLNVIAYKRVV